MPSMTMASTPERTSFLAITRAGAKHITLAPCLMREMAAPGGRPPANTIWPTLWSRHTSTSSISWGWSVIRLTPNGMSVRAAVAAISFDSRSGDMEPEAITPKPPALDRADTRWRSETQVMAPPMIASSDPRKRRPRSHSLSRWSRAACRFTGSHRVQTVGRMQAAHGELGVFLGDQHADLDFGSGDDLDVDTLFRQRLEHALRHTGVAAHADTDYRYFHHIGIRAKFAELQRGVVIVQHLHRPVEVGLRDGEGEVRGLAALGHVLHDHVHIDVGVGQG